MNNKEYCFILNTYCMIKQDKREINYEDYYTIQYFFYFDVHLAKTRGQNSKAR